MTMARDYRGGQVRENWKLMYSRIEVDPVFHEGHGRGHCSADLHVLLTVDFGKRVG